MTIIFAMLLFGTIAYQIEAEPSKKFDCFRDRDCDQHRPKRRIIKHRIRPRPRVIPAPVAKPAPPAVEKKKVEKEKKTRRK